jgi:hypothetical protein
MKNWSGKRDSNSRPRPWQGRALPTELFPRGVGILRMELRLSTSVVKIYLFSMLFLHPNSHLHTPTAATEYVANAG